MATNHTITFSITYLTASVTDTKMRDETASRVTLFCGVEKTYRYDHIIRTCFKNIALRMTNTHSFAQGESRGFHSLASFDF